MTPAQQIQAILKHEDWTELKLSMRLGVTQSTVNRIKNGERDPSYKLLLKIGKEYAKFQKRQEAA